MSRPFALTRTSTRYQPIVSSVKTSIPAGPPGFERASPFANERLIFSRLGTLCFVCTAVRLASNGDRFRGRAPLFSGVRGTNCRANAVF